ncbi:MULTISPECIES: hypothetical protein [unclassified Mycobacterium]|uniref:hypothetical protein n=1 Tax=Mycobacterium TaxID=1763 RepID=UPI000CC9FED4|nr:MULTISPECIES: hypothetical protein [unclassified Mycobacterium]MDP7707660.1 hypothetical protein [Mycobacterium sp. TY815]MDP7733082.1 hypothetical protein [Mycobacterium sp. TY813]PJE00433.1 MAG: hypothetical protein CK428_32445 [Mycobacterium sp.]
MANFSVTPDSVRAGAGKIGTESALVSGLAVPDPAAAAAGLAGFVTAAQLSAARDAVVSALKVAGGRCEQMALLFRNAADAFALADLVTPGLLRPSWLSQQVGDGLTAMGEMNLTPS